MGRRTQHLRAEEDPDIGSLQPELPAVAFNLNELVVEIQTRHFPRLDRRVCLWFVPICRLASVLRCSGGVYILAHPLLNHADTPREVMAFVIKHEMLHLGIPPREVDGEWKQHPPEFWTAEAAMAPDSKLAWAWIWMNLGTALRRRPESERTEVLKRWRTLRALPRTTLDQVASYAVTPGEMDDISGAI